MMKLLLIRSCIPKKTHKQARPFRAQQQHGDDVSINTNMCDKSFYSAVYDANTYDNCNNVKLQLLVVANFTHVDLLPPIN